VRGGSSIYEARPPPAKWLFLGKHIEEWHLSFKRITDINLSQKKTDMMLLEIHPFLRIAEDAGIQ